MNKKIADKVNRIITKHGVASSLEDLCRDKDFLGEISIEAGPKRYKIPSKYHYLFIPVIEQMKEMSHDALMDELRAKEDYDG